MKKDIHPQNYRPVLFIDSSNGEEFLISSTIETEEKAKSKRDGKEYPVYRVEISSASHPFYTGKAKVLDTAGRVEKFKARQGMAKPKKNKKERANKKTEDSAEGQTKTKSQDKKSQKENKE